MTTSPVDIGYFRNIAEAAQDRRDLVLRAITYVAPRSMLELGVWKGDLAARVLREVPDLATYWLLDPWRNLDDWNKPFNVPDSEFEDVYDTAKRQIAFAGERCRVLRGTTTEKIAEIADGSLDLAYIDGDHTLRGVTVDLVATWPKLKPGGVLLGDDFAPSIWQHRREFEPTMVFPFACYFAEGVGAPMMALPYMQFVMVKPEPGQRIHSFEDPTGTYWRRAVLDHLKAAPRKARAGDAS